MRFRPPYTHSTQHTISKLTDSTIQGYIQQHQTIKKRSQNIIEIQGKPSNATLQLIQCVEGFLTLCVRPTVFSFFHLLHSWNEQMGTESNSIVIYIHTAAAQRKSQRMLSISYILYRLACLFIPHYIGTFQWVIYIQRQSMNKNQTRKRRNPSMFACTIGHYYTLYGDIIFIINAPPAACLPRKQSPRSTGGLYNFLLCMYFHQLVQQTFHPQKKKKKGGKQEIKTWMDIYLKQNITNMNEMNE